MSGKDVSKSKSGSYMAAAIKTPPRVVFNDPFITEAFLQPEISTRYSPERYGSEEDFLDRPNLSTPLHDATGDVSWKNR